jgi:hypothetical protein
MSSPRVSEVVNDGSWPRVNSPSFIESGVSPLGDFTVMFTWATRIASGIWRSPAAAISLSTSANHSSERNA